VFEKFALLNPHKASDPDNVPAWLLKENTDILALVVTDILNSSYSEARLPNSWKQADITLIPKSTPDYDINKHLKPISLTPILSKLAKEFVVDRNVKPALLAKVDPRQFGTGSSTTEALVSMIHTWTNATDGNGATVRVILFDFKKAFDLIDHHILIRKLYSYDFADAVISWITDFLTSRKQRVKLGQDCFSEWSMVPYFVISGDDQKVWYQWCPKLRNSNQGEAKQVHYRHKLMLKMLDARPGFIIKFLKRSLIVNLFKTQAFDCQSAVFDR
jgi:hypothetical protein